MSRKYGSMAVVNQLFSTIRMFVIYVAVFLFSYSELVKKEFPKLG